MDQSAERSRSLPRAQDDLHSPRSFAKYVADMDERQEHRPKGKLYGDSVQIRRPRSSGMATAVRLSAQPSLPRHSDQLLFTPVTSYRSAIGMLQVVGSECGVVSNQSLLSRRDDFECEFVARTMCRLAKACPQLLCRFAKCKERIPLHDNGRKFPARRSDNLRVRFVRNDFDFQHVRRPADTHLPRSLKGLRRSIDRSGKYVDSGFLANWLE